MTASAMAIYNETVDLLKLLDENQLKKVHSLIVDISASPDTDYSPLGISTEEQLWDHIELSVSHARQGVGRDADSVICDMKKEFSV